MSESTEAREGHQRRCVLCREGSATLLIRAPRAAAYMAVCGPCALAAIDTERGIDVEQDHAHRLGVLQEKGDRPGNDGRIRRSGGGDRHGRRGRERDEHHVWLCVCGDGGTVRVREHHGVPEDCGCTDFHPQGGYAGL